MKILDDIYTEFDQESYDETLRNAGRIEGIKQASIANAKNFLRMNLGSPEQIAQGTSLPLEQVLALKEELSHEPVTETN